MAGGNSSCSVDSHVNSSVHLFLPGDGHHLTVRLVGAVLSKQRQHDVAAVVLCVVCVFMKKESTPPQLSPTSLVFFAHSRRAVTIADSKVGSQALSWSGLPFAAFVNVSIKVRTLRCSLADCASDPTPPQRRGPVLDASAL